MNSRDFAVVQSILIMVSVTMVVTNFTVDFIYTLIDPRMRAANRRADRNGVRDFLRKQLTRGVCAGFQAGIPLAHLSLAFATLLVVVFVFADWLAPYDYRAQALRRGWLPPFSSAAPLRTCSVGLARPRQPEPSRLRYSLQHICGGRWHGNRGNCRHCAGILRRIFVERPKKLL